MGTTAELAVVEPDRLDVAIAVLREELAAIDEKCNRFRDDSELNRVCREAGTTVQVTDVFAEAVGVALHAAELTDGLVDPTVGAAVIALGFDGDFATIRHDDPRPYEPVGPVPGWWRIKLDPVRRELTLPQGVRLDLGATALPLIVDTAATEAARVAGCGVLVRMGGDVAVAGDAPPGGWQVGVGDGCTPHGPSVAITSGGLATSRIAHRTWRRGGRTVHHILDPRTGDVPPMVWRSVSVAAGTAVDANTASTAAVVLGRAAVDWLRQRDLPARLVDAHGLVVTVAGWPADRFR